MKCMACESVFPDTRPTCPKCSFLSPIVVGVEGLPPGEYDLMMGEDGRYYVIGEHGKKKH